MPHLCPIFLIGEHSTGYSGTSIQETRNQIIRQKIVSNLLKMPLCQSALAQKSATIINSLVACFQFVLLPHHR